MTNAASSQVCESPAASSAAMFANTYDRLKQLAHRQLRQRSRHTLNTTALVHEVYLKLALNEDLSFEHEAKFFEYAAISMRHILVNYAGRHLCMKRGGDVTHVDLTQASADDVKVDPSMALQLDAALQALEAADKRAAKVVELHFFSGLPLDQVARMIGVVRRTADRDWRYARAYLLAHAD